jgi:ferredoxin
MTYVIAQPCIGVSDAGCIDVCPMDCIHGTAEDEMLYIDPEGCIDCDACVPECPVDAIYPEDKLPEKWRDFTWINANYFEKKRTACG